MLPVDDYRGLLAKVDEWYRSVKERHPGQVPCARGCRDCCIGLFDVSLADRDLLREGMAAADPAVRKDIEERAGQLMSKLRELSPDLGETLDGWSADDVDDRVWPGPVSVPSHFTPSSSPVGFL